MTERAGRVGPQPIIVIKGAGDLATGVAYRLWQSGFALVMTDLAEPLCVRRAVSFAEAVAAGRHTVEGVTAVRATTPDEAAAAVRRREVPVLVDATGEMAARLRPAVLVDGVMAKRNTGTRITDAPVVIALGPGYTAGIDCHAVVETLRGHRLGRVLYAGSAAPDTGTPGEVAGVAGDRVLRAPAAGRFRAAKAIGDLVAPGEQVGAMEPPEGGEPVPVVAGVGGVIRGLIRDGIAVPASLKIGDVDPTGDVSRCFTISDKALAVGGGVLEAVMHFRQTAFRAGR